MPDCLPQAIGINTAKDYSRAKTVELELRDKAVFNCHQPLKICILTPRQRWPLDPTKSTELQATKSCLPHHKNKKTRPKPQEIYRSTEAEMLSLKFYQFSIDVIVKVGFLHFKQHQTIDEIRQTLKKLHICRSKINLLCQAYSHLNTVRGQQATQPTRTRSEPTAA